MLKSRSAVLMTRLEQSPLVRRWQQLAPRERTALAALTIFLLAVLLYLLLWRPAEQARTSARHYFEQQRELNAYLQAQAPQVRSAGERPVATVDPAQLQGLVTASAEQQGLTVERLDGEGEGGVQVALRPAAFASLLRWIADLDRRGVRVEEAGLDGAGDGRVAARLTLRVVP